MNTTTTSPPERHPQRGGLNPIHGVLLAGTFILFLGAAITDYAYAESYQIQWATFSSWLIAFALVLNGLSFLGGVFNIFRKATRRPALIYCALLLVSFVTGFINALVHARDAWAMMPTGLVLSIVVAVLTGVAAWLGFSRLGSGVRS